MMINSSLLLINKMNDSDSIDFAKEAKESDLDLGQKHEFVQEIAMRSTQSNRKKYGNMLVVY